MPQIIEVPGHGQVEFPDGMTDAQIVAAIQRNSPQAQQAKASVATNPEVNLPMGLGTIKGETSTGFNPAAAIIKAGDAISSVNRGIQQTRFGPTDWLRQKLGMQETGITDALKADAERAAPGIKELQDVHPGSTLIGDMSLAAGVPWRALPAIAASEYGSPLERAQKGITTFLGGKLAEKGGQIAGKALARAEQKGAEAASQNAARDETTQLALREGLRVPPVQANPTATNRALEGYAGKISTQQGLSVKNQPVVDSLIKRDLGLPVNKPATEGAIEAVRIKAYNEGYAPIKREKALVADEQFQRDVGSLGGEDYAALIREVPEEANAKIDRLAAALTKSEFSGSTAVNLIRKYRSDAAANFKNRADPEALAAAQAQLAAAEALEGLVERNLAARGMPDAVTKFREARTMIAKAHDAEAALNKSTGSFDANHYGRLFDKGKPLTGGGKTVGQVANMYPKAMQEVNSSMPGVSPLDYAAIGSISAATGMPTLLAGLVGRPAARGLLTSKAYQSRMTTPDYGPNGLLRGADLLLNNRAAPYLGGLLGYEVSP